MLKKYISIICLAVSAVSCSDFLDMQPLDKVTPDAYFNEANQLGDYAIKYYNFPSLGSVGDIICNDNGTDIQVGSGVSNRWVPGEMRVASAGSDWTFDRIRAFNYFFAQVLPRYEAGQISGNSSDIRHYIGEVYFLRAYEYFNKMKAFGDFPIITEVLPDKMEELIAANKRRPMNHVARFILKDLDTAIDGLLTHSSQDGNNRNRLTRDAALLFKSRVALYTATWLKYFKGTAFVPGTPDWPGNTKDYNRDIVIYETDIDHEVAFFLDQAMKAAEQVADKVALTRNTFDDPTKLQYSPYVRMFADYDLSTYPEVLFWRDYDMSKGVTHRVNNFVQWPANGGNTGYSRGYMESFLMQSGKPIYADSEYKGDTDFETLRYGRDDRLRQFIKAPGDELSEGLVAINPVVYGHEYTTTGYIPKKYKSNKPSAATMGDDTGFPVFRAVEAYLNYIEADYELNGTLNSKSEQYWAAIRTRAGVEPDYRITDQATDMNIEKKNSFAACSAGKVVDVTLYNIRRERACEFIGEGFRYDDLRRWRAMDQFINTAYQIEGFNIWGSPTINSWYKGDLYYIGDGSGKTPNMSSPDLSNYIRPYQVVANNLLFDGMRWTPAHYLSPIDMGQFNITSDVEAGGQIDHATSPLYQNPGWPTISNKGPEMVPGFN